MHNILHLIVVRPRTNSTTYMCRMSSFEFCKRLPERFELGIIIIINRKGSLLQSHQINFYLENERSILLCKSFFEIVLNHHIQLQNNTVLQDPRNNNIVVLPYCQETLSFGPRWFKNGAINKIKLVLLKKKCHFYSFLPRIVIDSNCAWRAPMHLET